MPVSRGLRVFLVLLSLSLPAFGQKQADRIYNALQIPEGCDRAERERPPICFCHIGAPNADVNAMALDRIWKETLERMSGECVVIASRFSERGYLDFVSAQFRTPAGTPGTEYIDAVLMDPWQEERLGEVRVGQWLAGEGTEKPAKLLAAFSKGVGELEQKAKAWKTATAPKPEKWTDVKDRSMTAAALAWDGKTATFRLQNGKTATLDAGALSPEAARRLSKIYRPKLPFVNAADEAALAAAPGKEVCVVGRANRDTGVSGWSISGVTARPDGKVFFVNFSPLFGIKYDQAMHDQFVKMRPRVTEQIRGRAYGIVEKDEDHRGKYAIRVTDPRQYGPGAAAE